MGIVFKQSLQNTIITAIGFGIGAINALFLYANFLSDEYYGLVTVLLSTAAILMPLFSFGVHNTLVKYYSSFRQSEEQDGFLSLMLLLPLLTIIPATILTYFGTAIIGDFMGRKNALVKDYVWYIFLIGLAMGYFEVFYAWSKVHLKSVFGNFMKEVFVRFGVTILLLMVYLDYISVITFLKALVALYMLRTVLMKIYAYLQRSPRITFQFPKNTKAILWYSALIILGGSAAVIQLEIDRFMINQYVAIENVAYYSVAIFIATVVAVPSRSMHQITYPLTATLMNTKDHLGLKKLYQKSSLTLFAIAGLLFLLIVLNIADLYCFIPLEYRDGALVVFIIGLAKVFDAILGNSNAILYNSNYYKTVLALGVVLAIFTVLFNLWLIPLYGVEGAALATFLAIAIYNVLKLSVVGLAYKIWPFTQATFWVFIVLLLLGGVINYIPLQFHPIINIILRSVLFEFKISEDISTVLSKYLKRKTP